MTRPFLPATRAAAAAALLYALLAGAAQAAPIDELRRQIEASQFEQAYATALAHPQLIGDVHFDLLYGLAAINVGRVPEGLLALERHLTAVPANDRARLELARGYFLLGEFARARAEFEFVLRYNPPAGTRERIAGFLQAMQMREGGAQRSDARLYAEAGIGHDNNVNLGTHHLDVATAFGTLTLDPDSSSRQVGDGQALFALGGQQLYRVSNRFAVFGGADLDHRENFEHKAFNLSNLGLYAGFTQLAGNTLWRTTLGAGQFLVGGNRYRGTLSAQVEATYTAGPELAFSGVAQYLEGRHPQADQRRDFRAATLGVAFTRSFSDSPLAPQIGGRIAFTDEKNQANDPSLDRDLLLLRLYAAATPIERTRIVVGLLAMVQRFGAVDIGFGNVREDHTFGADLALTYALDGHWSLRADAVWTINDSTQQLYEHKRKAVSLKVRYQF